MNHDAATDACTPTEPPEFPPAVDLTWQERSACRTADPALFGPIEAGEKGGGERVQAAKAVCAACPVMAECWGYAIGLGDVWGVFAGQVFSDGKLGTLRDGVPVGARVGRKKQGAGVKSTAPARTPRVDAARYDAHLVAGAVQLIVAGASDPLAGLNGTESAAAVCAASAATNLTPTQLAKVMGRSHRRVLAYLADGRARATPEAVAA